MNKIGVLKNIILPMKVAEYFWTGQGLLHCFGIPLQREAHHDPAGGICSGEPGRGFRFVIAVIKKYP
jgi:hypothetical protein